MTIRTVLAGRKRFFGTVESMGRVPYAEHMDRISVDIDKPWLTVADICEYMDVSTFVVTSVLRTGELRAVKFGREWRVAKVDFEDWINSQRSADVGPVTEDEPSRR
jgi:excisionase family DNA binding protein